MNDSKIFIDSNIILSLFDGDERRKNFAASLPKQNHTISTQVVNENVAVCLRPKEKRGMGLTKQEAFSHGIFLMDSFNLVQISRTTIHRAFDILDKYGFSFWDSLILSSAIKSGCNILYSEDMQNDQIIEDQLTIINPFLKL